MPDDITKRGGQDRKRTFGVRITTGPEPPRLVMFRA